MGVLGLSTWRFRNLRPQYSMLCCLYGIETPIFTLRVLCIYLCMMTYLFKRYFRVVLGSQKTCLTGFKFLSLWDAVTLCLLVVI